MKINDVDINYIEYGNKKGSTILLLHGWGQNIEMMKFIGDEFQKTNNILIVDLPGHGSSTEPSYPWEVIDFVNCIREILERLKIVKVTIIGHSFGGKIALLYASLYKVDKLVLFGSPFKKEIQELSTRTKVLKGIKKALKPIPILNKFENFAKKHIGSEDYKNASPMMRDILVNTVNLDITDDLINISSPTLMIWGTLDKEVPIDRAYELEKLIKDSGVVEYPTGTHYAYLENKVQTIKVLKSFLGGS